MIGSAWLFGPFYAAKIAGPQAIIGWLLGGLATLLIAFTFAELSSMLPIAGGMSRFPELSHGSLTNLIMSWLAWLSCVTMPPIEVQATLQYAATYFPQLVHLLHGIPVLTSIGFCWAAILMFGLCVINVVSFKGLVRFNFILFIFKIAVIVITVATIIHTKFHLNNFATILPDFQLNHWQAILTSVASGGIAFAFTGFTHGIALAAETKRPNITIPVAIIGSIICCLLLYISLQTAFIGALSPESIKNGWHHLTFYGEAGPFVGIASLLGLFWLAKLLYIDATVSPLGAGLIYVTSTARMVYALSKNGFFPTFLSRLTTKGFPIWAIILNFTLGMFLFLPLPGWQAMVNFLVSSIVIAYAMGPIALLCLRKQLPNVHRPFRLPFPKIICLLAFYCCNLISYWTGWETLSKLSVAISIGFILLIIVYQRNVFDKKQFNLHAALWLVPYLAGLTIISYLGAFGGKNIIPFGWDFLIIAMFTLAIQKLALMTRLDANQEQYLIYRQEVEV